MLELVDAQGKVLKTTRTSFDGFYSILDIPSGTYQLRASESELKRLGLGQGPAKPILIKPEGTIIDDLELVFESAPSGTPAGLPKKDPS
jgi:hypothetical protein